MRSKVEAYLDNLELKELDFKLQEFFDVSALTKLLMKKLEMEEYFLDS